MTTLIQLGTHSRILGKMSIGRIQAWGRVTWLFAWNRESLSEIHLEQNTLSQINSWFLVLHHQAVETD